MSDVSVREVAAYYVDSVLNNVVENHKDFESCENSVEVFMGANFPSYKLTTSRKEKLMEHVGKLLERSSRQIKTTIKSYDK